MGDEDRFHNRSQGVMYNMYSTDLNAGRSEEEDKSTLPQRLVTLALTLNSISLVLSMSVIVVVVTLTMSLVSQPATNSSTTSIRPIATMTSPPSSLPGRSPGSHSSQSSQSGGSQSEREDDFDVDPVAVSQAFGQLLALSPLFIISSLMGLSSSQKTSSTGTIVCYWLTLTFTLLMTVYVTSEFVDYENFLGPRQLLPEEEMTDGGYQARMPAVEGVSRLVVFIGSLQMISAILMTIAKYQKKRVAVKEPSLYDLNNSVNILIPNQGVMMMVNQDGRNVLTTREESSSSNHLSYHSYPATTSNHLNIPVTSSNGVTSSTFILPPSTVRVIQASLLDDASDSGDPASSSPDDVMMMPRPVPAPSVTLIRDQE